MRGGREKPCGFHPSPSHPPAPAHLHALIRCDAVEGVLVAAPPAAQHGFGPSTEFDARMRTDYFVALLGQSLAKG
eukprot:scaffold24595_cov79-Isochrysis_galbana.AAC.1